MKNQKGFTLIELIIVIVILGILAVTAAPQFINFGADARESKTLQLRGAVQAASQQVFTASAIAGVEGDEDDGEDTPGFQTASGYEVVFGYPAASPGGIIAALNIDSADWDILYGDDANADVTEADAEAYDTKATVVRISLNGINTSATTLEFTDIENCYIQYTEADVKDSAPTIVFVEGDGC